MTRSLFVHTLFVNFVLLLIQRSLSSSLLFTDTRSAAISLGVLIPVWVIILTWQIGGCLRAANKPSAYSGSGFNSYLVFLGSLIAAVMVMSGIFSLYYSYLEITDDTQPADVAAAKPYQFVRRGTNVLVFNGDIHFGATRDLIAMLEQQPDISQIVLNSDGGIIVEARGMANAVSRFNLDTHVNTRCYSACTLVFINGYKRSLAADAELGFHQYLIESQYPLSWINTTDEHAKDQQRFEQQNISRWFIEKMYTQPHDSLWIPTHDELLRAGVLTSDY